MDGPIFLSVDDILEIHRDQILRYGGAIELRDKALLQSAVAMPYASFGGYYLHKNIYGMAAAYLFHLCQNHPFLDGNKRTSLAAALTFLYMNGIKFLVAEETLESLVLSVAQGNVSKQKLSNFFLERAGSSVDNLSST